MKKNNKVLMMVLGGTLLITSACGNNSTSSSLSSEFVSSSSVEQSSSTSSSISSSFSLFSLSSFSNYGLTALETYRKKLELLNNYRNQIKTLYNVSFDDKNETIDNKLREYWKEYTALIKLTQEKLKDSDIRQSFVDYYGELETRYIEGIDTSKIFFNRELPSLDCESYVSNGKMIITNIANKVTPNSIIPAFSAYMNCFNKVLEAYYLTRIYANMYENNQDIQKEFNTISTAYTEMANDYKVIFKNLLNSDLYRPYAITYYSLTDEEVESLSSTETYSNELIELFKEEKELENLYNYSNPTVDLKDLYVSLVNVRKQIAEKLGYSSYMEYVYEVTYNRDYTIDNASTLIDNITSNKKLNTQFANTKNLTSSGAVVGENDLLNALSYVSKVVSSSPTVLKNLKTYGNYTFDTRSNKYNGSYEAPLSLDKEYFIFIGGSGTVVDYSSAFHEYGHYLANYLYPNRENSLDVAEIQSQGLEYLMSNYYSNFLSSEDVKYMIRHNIVNALWTIYSSAMISKFENAVYSLDEVNVSKVTSLFNSYQLNYIYPYSLGSYGYCTIPHLYTSPGYYISYLVSIIPALEIWSETKLNDSITKYNTILNSEYTSLNDILQEANIYSPFDSRAIDKIVSKIEQLT